MATCAQYVAMVTKMVENHGYLNAGGVVLGCAAYVTRAYDEGMTAVRCANNIVKKCEMAR